MRVAKRALALCVALTMLCLCACSYKPIDPEGDELDVVGEVGGKEVYLEELRFAAYTYKGVLESRYGEGIFEGDRAEEYLAMLRELVYANITANYAVLLLCEEVMIRLGEQAVVDKVDATLAQMVEELGGMSKYKKHLKENRLTDHLLRFNTEIELLKNELRYVYIDDLAVIEDDDEKLLQIIEDDIILIRHVFIPYSEEGAYDKICDARGRLETGEDFYSLMSEYNRDDEMSEKGTFIIEGYTDEEYEESAFELEVGEVSDIVSLDDGYYIIERLNMDMSTVWLNFNYLKDMYQNYTFLSIIDDKQDTLTFVPNALAEEFMKSPFDS